MYPIKSAEFLAASDLETGPDAALEICHHDTIGLGVRSVIAFAKGDVLDRFDGRIDTHISQHSLQISPGRHIAETRFVGFLSHGCAPNCALDMDKRRLIALKDIAAGEWLRIDYSATEDTLFRDFDCACGAANCRGQITGRLAANRK